MSEISLIALYLSEMHRIRNTGLAKAEVSYYPALEAALNTVGHTLKPRVVCIQHPKASKGDHPDLGLFEVGSGKLPPPDWTARPVPDRGVVEAKPLTSDLEELQTSAQVSDYLATFGLVLITNYREFRLLTRSGTKIEIREKLELAEDEASFWGLHFYDEQIGVSFAEFLKRALLYRAPLRSSEEVAFFLASYAREAMAKLEAHSSLPALVNLRTALEKALGLEFRDADGERLFRSTLVQTLFYGLFSAWVLRCEAGETSALSQ